MILRMLIFKIKKKVQKKKVIRWLYLQNIGSMQNIGSNSNHPSPQRCFTNLEFRE